MTRLKNGWKKPLASSSKMGHDRMSSDEILAAEINSRKNENPAKNVLQWMIDVGHGVLSTISVKDEISEFPLSSVVPFAINHDGKPYILIASIAAHTKNLIKDQRSSLFISHPNPEGDPQSYWRACLIGKFKEVIVAEDDSEHSDAVVSVSSEQQEAMLTRYKAQVPNADAYLKTHNFSFWSMDEIISIRYIAGFGKICWIGGDEYLSATVQPSLDEVKSGSIEHMNDDHVDAMVDIYNAHFTKNSAVVHMDDLDSRGIFLQCMESNHQVYIPYGKTITSDELRVSIIDLVKQARIIAQQ